MAGRGNFKTNAWKDSEQSLKLPATAFSGPGKDDIVNALSMFFGAPAQPEKLADYTAVAGSAL